MKQKRLQTVLNSILIMVLMFGFFSPAEHTVNAATTLSITPITWNVIGLDSNNVNVGPNTFPVGARVCNTGTSASNAITADFYWDSANSYVSLSAGSTATLTLASGLAAGACTDFYYEVEVTRNSGAYDTTRRYHITATEAGPGGGRATTPMPRELYVEHLISQSRNTQTNLELSTDGSSFDAFGVGQTVTMLVGQTYWLRLTTATATNGYEQIESYLNLPNVYFQVLSVTTDYAVGTDIDKLYGDACTWENDPNSPNYRSCLSTGKAGGDPIRTTYQVRILQYRSTDPTPVYGMVYDFSGSSYHYNSDYMGDARDLYNLDPTQIGFTKTFVPDAITPASAGGTSQLTFRIPNPSTLSISGINFTDTFPSGLVVAATPGLSYTGCGSSPSASGVTAGSGSIGFSNLALAPGGTCTIKLSVSGPVGNYSNTTSNLGFTIGTTNYTGPTATDQLTIATSVYTCTNGTMAQWTIPNNVTNPPTPSTQAGNVSTATVAASDTKTTGFAAGYNSTYAWDVWGFKNGNQTITFTIDTRNYSDVTFSFWYRASSANSPTSMVVSYSNNGTIWNTLGTYTPTLTWTQLAYSGLTTSTTGNTLFRITASGAQNDGSDAALFFDDMTFSGCSYSPPPGISKAFGMDPIVINTTSLLTFTVTNNETTPYRSVPLTGVSFTDTLPSGLSVASGTQTNNCGGTLTANVGTSTISLSGGSIGAATTCTISVPVVGTVLGVHDNVSGRISATESGANTSNTGIARDDITVIGPPIILKEFGTDLILTGSSTSLTFTVTNPNPTVALTGVAITDSLPAGLVVSTPNGLNATCSGGTITAVAGSSSVTMSGSTLNAASSCTISINVTGTSSGTKNNTVSVTSTNGGNGLSSSDTLYVRDPQPSLGLSKKIGLSASGPWYDYVSVYPNPSQDVYYQFAVENNGDVALSNIGITDGLVVTSTCAFRNPLPVAVAANDDHITTCVVGPVSVTAAGNVTNTATASGSYGGTTATDTDTARYATVNLSLEKSSYEKFYTATGQIIHYTYLVTNSGFATLRAPVTVTDDMTTVSCPLVSSVGDHDDWFEPGESMICSATYTTTDVASITNLAVATVEGFSVSDSLTLNRMSANYGHLPYSATPGENLYPGMNLFNEGGAVHLTNADPTTGTYLGQSVPSESDGSSSPTYTADPGYDEGVNFSGTWTNGDPMTDGGTVSITVQCGSNPCYLGGWIDWNRDGDFDDLNEQIIATAVNDGFNPYFFSIPSGVDLITGFTFYTRFRIYAENPVVYSPDGMALNASGEATYGEVEDYELEITDGVPVTTPVTLSYFKAERRGDQVNFYWSTATETGNVGFNLYVGDKSSKTLINSQLIASNLIDSLSRQDYSYSAKVSGNTFFIEDVNILGETRLHGPFQLGKPYGARIQADKINWALIHRESRIKQSSRQKNLAAELLSKDVRIIPTASLNFKVTKTGIYRVTYEMLRAAGYDLIGVPKANIGLSNQGKSVPITVFGTSTFGPGCYIEFYGQALDTIYTATNVYSLQLNAINPARIPVITQLPTDKTGFATQYAEVITINNQKAYSNYAPGMDAWYDTTMLVYTTPKTWSFPFTIIGLANSSTPVNLKLFVWGATNWPDRPDHHLQVSLNGAPIADQTYDGVQEQIINLTLPTGLLVEGTNTLQIVLPGDSGVSYEVQRFDQFSITYPRVFKAQGDRLNFTAAARQFKVTNFTSSSVVVYRLNPAGTITRLSASVTRAADGTFTVSFLGDGLDSTYMISSTSTLLTATYEARRTKVDLDQPAEYLIISHPDFMAGLAPLVSARQAQFSVRVVDVNDLYERFTYGIFDPQAIQQYIEYAARNLGTKYVLLVGGDTYDYRNYLGRNGISFIPSLYAATGALVKSAPADPLYADLDGDNIQDLAIGRFPVRTSAELEMMIQKTLSYSAKTYGKTSLFASDTYDQGISFKDINIGMASTMPTDWTMESIHLDDLDIDTARALLVNGMNQGTALVTYTGHSEPIEWSFSSLFTKQMAANLTNQGKPFVVVQWGCWNTYYVDPVNNYLVQSFLFSGDRGAAAVLGATTLSEVISEQMLGQLLTPKLATPGMFIGDAVQQAKAELGATHPEMLDVLLGWSLMGDPALVIEP